MKMKLLPLFLLFFFILLTQAQRRTTAKTSTEPSTTRSSVSRGRGRSRFVTSVEYQNVRETSSTPESVPRKTVTSRRRVVENVEQRFPSRSVSTPSPTPSKPAITFTVNSERRALAPTFGDTVEKIFTVNESPIKRTSKPAAVPQISARRTPKPLTDYVERKNFKSTKNTYEVQEVINEDFELVRRVKKPRVLIESTNNQVSVPLRSIDRKEFFRTGSVSRRNQENADSVLATKFPKRTKDTQEGVLNFPPRKLENLEPPKSTTSEAPVSEEPINNISNGNLLEEQPLDTTLVPVEFESSPDPLQAEEVKEELTNVNLVSSTSKPIEEPRSSANRRNGLRKNTNVIEQSTAAPRFRTRGRSSPAAQAEQSSRAPEFNFQSVTPTATPNRGFRRRLDTITEPRKGPSVFSAETQFPESRSRTGRKIDLPTPEKLTLEIPTRNRRRTTTPKINKESSMPTFPSRNRFRSREMPIIDEQKLEVLPLFEVEPKLVNTRVMNRADVVFQPKKSKDKDELMTRKINDIDARSRRRGGLELIQASSTEIKSTEIPARSRVAVSVSVETRTESSVRRSIPNRRSEVKESVVSEINEVTSRKKVSRKKVNSNSSNEIKIKPLPVYRGSKKSDVVVKKGSSEEVDESDNYPEAFKALIKSKKESRPVPSSLPLRASNVVTSVPSFSTTFHPSTFKEVTDSDNEIKPKALPTSTSSRWNRSRSTTTSSVKLSEPLPPKRFPSRTSPYTTSEPISEKRFPSRTTPSVSISTTPIYRGTKLRTLTPRTFSAPPKLEKSVSFKPRSSVAEKNIEIKQFNRNRNAKRAENPVLLSTKVPKYTTTAKKLDRGKYRSEYSSRGSTTTAPKYIPTIPSVPYIPTIPAITPVRTMVDTSNQKDHDDGIHVISIDEPVNALQSANLVKGDFVSSTANSVSDILPLVNDGTTEKTVSIIERIINSISARSTTPPSSGTPFSSTASTTESPSAILKLSPKKSRQTDLTDSSKTTESNDTVPFTTENPTTIIEKILSSLNAIQATDITSAGQVGIDFNTLTSFTTTPVSSVTKSSTSRPLLAPSSTTIFPLSILDELSEENKQKETVRKLLDLLNGLVSPQQQEVVVTPKYVNNRTPGRGPFVSTTFFPLSTASPELTTAPTVSSSTSTEQISSNFILSENTSPQIVSEIPNTTETTVTISTSTEVIPTVDSQSTTSLEELASTESATSNTEIVNSSVNTIIENIATNSDSPSTIGTTTENFTPSIPAGTEFGTIPIDVSSFFTTFTTPSSFQRFEDDQNTIPSVDVKSNRVAASTTQATTSSTKAQTTITQSPITTTEAKSRTTLSEISTTTPPITSTSTVTPSNTQTTIMSKAEPTTIPSTIPLETSNTSSLPFSTEQSSTTSTSTLPSTTVLNSNTVTLPQDSINASTLDLESTKLTATESSTNTLSTSDSSTAEPDLVVVESITVLSTTMGSNSVPPTFPTLSEILNDKTLEAFNEIVSNSDQVNTNISNQTDNGRVSKYIKVLNIQDLIKGRNSEARSRGKPISIKVGTTIPISNEIVSTESSSTIKSTMSTEQAISTTTNTVTSTTSTPEVTPLKSEETSTEDNAILSNKILDDTTLPAKPTPFSAIQKIGTTRKLTPTTITPIFISTTPSVFPTFLTTFFPNLFPDEATRKPKVSTSSPGVIRISAAPSVTQTTFTERPVTTTQAVTTTRPTTTTTTTTTTTNAPTTTTRPPTTTKIVTTTTPATTITTPSTTPKPTTTTTIPTTPQPTTTTRMTTSPTRVTLGETVTVSTTGRTDAITDFNTIEVTTTAIKLKGLSSEQKNNLREIAQLEKEQAALLQQLSFLTNLGLGQNRGPKSVANDKTKNSNANPASSLAERILALAVQRDKNSKSTSTVATTVTTSSTTKLPTSIQDQIAALETTKAPTKATPVLEEVLKQYNLNGLNVAVTSPTSTVYGKSEDAILASLLKEQGIVPSTPAVLAGVFDETTIRPRRPKATTPQPGPIMRGLNWLLNTLAPTPAPATKRPTPKPVKPNKPPVEEELLVNSPTHMTPIATAAPSKIANALSQEDIKKLINQLEDIQKNPSKGTLDLSQIKSIQNLINLDGGVVVSTNGEHGTTSRITTTQSTTPTVQTTQRQPKKMVTLPTEDPLSAISSSEDGFGFDSVESTTRTLRAPVGFNPVPGVDDGSPNPLVQSNLITAAVNVTKAISNFLGTALQTVSQGAAASFQTLFGVSSVGTRVLGSASGGSSAG
ncbi:mucin-17-like isoform X5 [Diabrotica virgifera virgifera]|uniref:Mucin-5AC-like n=1 Tax=Diabrotica virgifera virgifera TaxID=50390 RepID=A0ABM5JUN1_DIAVI|nr:mucin-17-like isoform X5 [Diabrotica virgifera virgifera]